MPAEIVFGITAREIFPGAYSDIEKEVGKRIRVLRGQLKRQFNLSARQKRRHLKDMAKRLQESN